MLCRYIFFSIIQRYCRDETRKHLHAAEKLTTSNLDESYQYDDTANPPQIIQSDTSFNDPLLDAESYADVVTVSDDVDTCLSGIQYGRYDSLDDSSRPAFPNVHAYDNNNRMHSSGDDKCILQRENVTLKQVESSIEAQDYLDLIDYDLTDLATKKRPL